MYQQYKNKYFCEDYDLFWLPDICAGDFAVCQGVEERNNIEHKEQAIKWNND